MNPAAVEGNIRKAVGSRAEFATGPWAPEPRTLVGFGVIFELSARIIKAILPEVISLYLKELWSHPRINSELHLA